MEKESFVSKSIKLMLLHFFILSIIGVILRFLSIHTLPFLEYKYILHAHSHFAISGVVSYFLFIITYHEFVQKNNSNFKQYKLAFIIFMFSNYGMLIAFSIQGYKAISIFFSSLSLLSTNYIFYQNYRHSKKTQSNLTIHIVRWSIVCLILSSFAPFAMGPLMVSKYAYSAIYYNTIYFYLHFQYNGFFVLLLFALFTIQLDRNEIAYHVKKYKKGINILIISIFFSYCISVLWSTTSLLYNYISLFASLLQIISFIYIFSSIQNKKQVYNLEYRFLILIVFFSYLLKLIMQMTISFPVFTTNLMNNRNSIIGFLHLVLIGIVWLGLWYYSVLNKLVAQNKYLKIGTILFCIAYIFTEFMLFESVLNSWIIFLNTYRQLILFIISIFFPVSFFLLLYATNKCK